MSYTFHQKNKAMKATLAVVLISSNAGLCLAEETVKPPNAYRMEMLDWDGKPVATAIIWTAKFDFKERPKYNAKCKLKVLQTESTGEAVTTFNNIIRKPEEVVEVEIQSFPNSSPDTPPGKTPIRLCVNFNPGSHDHNVKMIVDESKNGFDALWYCELSSGSKDGGDVKISAIFAESVARD